MTRYQYRSFLKRLTACALAGALFCGCFSVQVSASETDGTSVTGWEPVDTVSDGEEADGQEPGSIEPENAGQTYILLPSAGFSYSFSAKKVSLRDVEDRLYNDGTITAKRTTDADTLTLSVSAAETAQEDSDGEETDEEEEEEEDRAIEETTLTPVQKKEQSVVEAVSETQNIEVDTATATILSATAVSVVSDTDTAVALAQMADKKQTQAKLDQGVISAVEAEALLAASQGTASEEDGTEETDSGEGSTDSAGTSADDAAQESSGTEESLTDSEGNELVIAQVSDYINIREEPDENSEIVGKLYNGSVATVLGRTGNGWARIQSGSVYGYIREEYVASGTAAAELAESVSTKQAVVTTQTLRVRAAAIADSDVISLIAEGETLEILEEVDGWYKVSTPDGEGYISSDFADVEDVYQEAVSVEEEEAQAAASESTDSTGTTSSSSSSSSSGSSSSRNSLNTYTGSVTVSGSGTGASVANYALQFVGNPYVWGGSSLTNGADCSGFTMAVYANFGVSLPHSSSAQASCGTAVASLDEAQAGDLLIYDGHVAIYLGNNQIVHASNPTNGITTGTATYRTILAIRRIFS